VAEWPATRASRVLAALLRIGWSVVRQRGSHRRLARPGWAPVTWAFHDGDELGSAMLAKIATPFHWLQTTVHVAFAG
jgi:predicted RNA binding protein YcfA (HicA-like mRNA interferase family)